LVNYNGAIRSVEELEERLSQPGPDLAESFSKVEGDILILGAGGKMGPSLARMAKRASQLAGTRRRIIAVSRFSASGLRQQLDSQGIETISCELLDEKALAQLPKAPNIVYLAGMKFGATGQEALTWAMNSFLPGLVCHNFPHSRIVAFSTGNVYGLSSVATGGADETHLPEPVGEYAMSCLGRERIFEHFSRTLQIPISLIRLNYACDLRYGVLVDLARKIQTDQPIDLTMGHFNTIWQGDANAVALRTFKHAASPPFTLNVTGAETLSVREISTRLGALMRKTPRFAGTEAPTALLSRSDKSVKLFGRPSVEASQLIEWVADWVSQGGISLGKPTHFESRDGKF